MKRFLPIIIALFLVAGAYGDPDNVLVKYDTAYGGTQISTVISTIWPSASVTYHDGNTWSAFDSSLTGGTDWDIVVVEACNYTSFTASHYTNLQNYYDGGGTLYFADWGMHFGYASGLISAMGATHISNITGGLPANYLWDDDHAIADGVTWGSDSHGWPFGTWGHRMNWNDAVPVSGWTDSETANQGGMMVANDGKSIITGFFASMITSGQEQTLWTNILYFMDGGGPPGTFSLLTPVDGEIIDVFAGRGGEPDFVAKTMDVKNAGTITFYNRTSDPVDVEVEFTWEESTNALEYQILVDDDYTFNTPVVDESGITDPTYTYTFSVDDTITYYWRVIASNDAGDTQCAEDFEFEFNYNNTNVAPASLGTIKATFQ